MTQDEIIRMAMEAGAVERYFGNQLHGIAFHKKELLERFAALVAANEREACAKVCEEVGPKEGALKLVSEGFAAAIRARSEK